MRQAHPVKHRNRLKVTTVLATLAIGTLAFGATAQAQDPDTAAGAGHAIVLQCSEFFGIDTPGTIVFTPSGNFNANCNPYAPPPSGAGGALVVQCSEVFGEGVSGNIVWQPNGHFKGHCGF